jgi:archaellum component FlaC
VSLSDKTDWKVVREIDKQIKKLKNLRESLCKDINDCIDKLLKLRAMALGGEPNELK